MITVYAQEVIGDPSLWTITDIVDTRDVDFFTGKPIPGTGAGRPCDRCGKKHDIVYHMSSNKGELASVGSTCAPKLAGGQANIDDYSLAKAKKEVSDRHQKKLSNKYNEWKNELHEKAKSIAIPEMHVSDTVDNYGRRQILTPDNEVVLNVFASELQKNVDQYIKSAKRSWLYGEVMSMASAMGIPQHWNSKNHPSPLSALSRFVTDSIMHPEMFS